MDSREKALYFTQEIILHSNIFINGKYIVIVKASAWDV